MSGPLPLVGRDTCPERMQGELKKKMPGLRRALFPLRLGVKEQRSRQRKLANVHVNYYP